jgi:hypothetical protein
VSKAKGDEAADRFEAWVQSQPLSYFREIANRNRTQLTRTVIMDAVGIDRPALRQNGRIQQLLHDLEARLRREGVLVGTPVHLETGQAGVIPAPPRPKGATSVHLDAERLSRLEKEVTAKDAELAELRPLRGENQKLKRLLRELQDQLARFQALESVLRESGRLPR